MQKTTNKNKHGPGKRTTTLIINLKPSLSARTPFNVEEKFWEVESENHVFSTLKGARRWEDLRFGNVNLCQVNFVPE